MRAHLIRNWFSYWGAIGGLLVALIGMSLFQGIVMAFFVFATYELTKAVAAHQVRQNTNPATVLFTDEPGRDDDDDDEGEYELDPAKVYRFNPAQY